MTHQQLAPSGAAAAAGAAATGDGAGAGAHAAAWKYEVAKIHISNPFCNCMPRLLVIWAVVSGTAAWRCSGGLCSQSAAGTGSSVGVSNLSLLLLLLLLLPG
jgi:hypothetical protein